MEIVKSNFKQNILILMTGTTIAQAIPVVISPILTRLYTPEDFGLFAFFIAIVGLFSVVASGRYEQAIIISKKEDDAINIFALGFMILSLLSLLLLMIVLIFHNSLIIVLDNKDIEVWLYFIPVDVFFIGLFNLLTLFNSREKKYKDISKATVVKSIALAVFQLSIGFIKSGSIGLISGHIISQLFGNIRLLKNTFKNKNFFLKINVIKIIALSKKFKNFPLYQVPHSMLNSFSSNIPVYLFASYFTLSVVGFYSLSARIILTPMMIIAGSTAKVYNQRVSEIFRDKGDSYIFTIKVLTTLLKNIFMPFLLLIFFAPEIFAFVFGDTWREAGVYTQILSPWFFMVFFVSIISFVPSLLDMQKKALLLESIYTVLRVAAILFGMFLNDIYLAIFLFSMVGFFMLIYNMYWILSCLKRLN